VSDTLARTVWSKVALSFSNCMISPWLVIFGGAGYWPMNPSLGLSLAFFLGIYGTVLGSFFYLKRARALPLRPELPVFACLYMGSVSAALALTRSWAGPEKFLEWTKYASLLWPGFSILLALPLLALQAGFRDHRKLFSRLATVLLLGFFAWQVGLHVSYRKNWFYAFYMNPGGRQAANDFSRLFNSISALPDIEVQIPGAFPATVRLKEVYALLGKPSLARTSPAVQWVGQCDPAAAQRLTGDQKNFLLEILRPESIPPGALTERGMAPRCDKERCSQHLGQSDLARGIYVSAAQSAPSAVPLMVNFHWVNGGVFRRDWSVEPGGGLRYCVQAVVGPRDFADAEVSWPAAQVDQVRVESVAFGSSTNRL
jgi:hypothetical protein